MADLSGPKRKAMRQDIQNTVNEGDSVINPESIPAIFGGGKVQGYMGIPTPQQKADAAAIANANLKDPSSYTSVRKAYIKNNPDPVNTEIPQQDPAWAQQSDADMANMANQNADDQMHKQQAQEMLALKLQLLKKQRDGL